MVFEKLKEILAEQLDVDANSITRESLLIEDLGADSLDAIDIVMSVEDEFKLEVPDEIIEKIETVLKTIFNSRYAFKATVLLIDGLWLFFLLAPIIKQYFTKV